ncbi:hypothetical protein EST38_g344 [Candolleomyces aberdarensis]|uniref:Uncharacterized protein n=1 Tax=Candolleomyces aberdarensis TaxID=2316362 RepID=A0A4Q2DZR9_9AGAR|nr:hypothetical protein EST38_g344 [Candolleomyces aberdarensis]
MFILFAWLLCAIECIRVILGRLADKFLHAIRLRPRSHESLPQVANPKVDPPVWLPDCPVITRDHIAPLKRAVIARPRVIPMMTSPIHQYPTIGFNSGPQARRVVFHDPFQPMSMSPMAGFEMPSTAFSQRESMAASIHFADIQSSSSTGTESLFTPPVFEFHPLNSPYEEGSTAPTSPASERFSATVEGDTGLSAELETEVNVPLSALMIQGVESETAKVSGALLAKGKDIPNPTQTSTLDASTSSPDAKDTTQPCVEVDIRSNALKMSTELSEAPPSRVVSQDSTVQDPEIPLDPPAWATDAKSPDYDEESVYSMDSYGPKRLSQDVRYSWAPPIVPEITLTPPSQPGSPRESLSYDRDSMPLFDEESSGRLHPSSLLDPFYVPAPRSPSPRIVDAEDEAESLVKRRRRNGCRMKTSSIDIILAGLDQQFPANIDADTQANIDLIMAGLEQQSPDLDEPSFFYSPPSSPSTTVRHSDGDLSGETLQYEEDLGSRWSDDEDDDDEDSDTCKSMSRTAKRDSLWSLEALSFSDSCSKLSTIAEEDEDSISYRASTAIIPDDRRFSGTSADTLRSSGRLSEEEWLSMIGDRAKRVESLPKVERPQRPTSSPLLWTPQAVDLASRRVGHHARSSSLTSAQPLPQRESRRHSYPEPRQSRHASHSPSIYPSDEFSLPSDCSSRGSEYRPWSLYTPPSPAASVDADSDCSMDGGASSPEDSSDSGASSPATSISTPDSTTAELEPEQDIEMPLFLDEGCPGAHGLGGILAILDSADFAGPRRYSGTRRYSKAASIANSVAKENMRMDAEDAGDDGDVSDAESFGWSEGDFLAYYAGEGSGSTDSIAVGAAF